MKLTDKRFYKFELLSIACGIISFCTIAGCWTGMNGVNWFEFWQFLIVILICWVAGGFIGCITSKDIKNIPIRISFWTYGMYMIVTALEIYINHESGVDLFLMAFITLLTLTAGSLTGVVAMILFKDNYLKKWL